MLVSLFEAIERHESAIQQKQKKKLFSEPEIVQSLSRTHSARVFSRCSFGCTWENHLVLWTVRCETKGNDMLEGNGQKRFERN